MRTDSPTETSTRFRAGRNSFISVPSIVVRRHLNNLNQKRIGNDTVDHAPLEPKSRGAIALPLPRKGFVMKPFDHPQSGRPGEAGDVLPFLVSLQDLLRDCARQLLVDPAVLLDAPHAIF